MGGQTPLESNDSTASTSHAMVMLAQAVMEAQGPVPTFSDFGQAPETNPWTSTLPESVDALAAWGDSAGRASLASPRALGLQAVTLFANDAACIFCRTDEIKDGCFVYRCWDASEPLTLSFSDDEGCWEVVRSSLGWIYRHHSTSETPAALIGIRRWQDRMGAWVDLTMEGDSLFLDDERSAPIGSEIESRS
mmetsp:Transcript_96961/g.172587  ORF Transcript_96961/g.172587 Transcript_96961/m.172587 type:complete len:192 (-) Transcript_96961:66-641(-)